jgi:hypothetical protein
VEIPPEPRSAPRVAGGRPALRVIVLFGFWPPTDVGIETRPGILWGWRRQVTYRGYDVLAVSPEFGEPSFGGDWGKGEGQLTVSYAGASQGFWRIVRERAPIAIMSFSRGAAGNVWLLEAAARNLRWLAWIEDPDGNRPHPGGSASDFSPYASTRPRRGSPPDPTREAGRKRESNLPMAAIQGAVNRQFGDARLTASINPTGEVGSFVSEYVAYHVAWYRDHTMDAAADRRCLFAGHTHVGREVDPADGAKAVALQLDELINVLPPQPALA